MRLCSTCRVDEARARRSTCRKCYNAYMRAYNKARYHRVRAEVILYLGSACVDCGSTKDLEFDHSDRTTKKFDIAKIWAYSAPRLKAEVDKCVLRCGPCHQDKTSRESRVEHGEGLTGKRNCYCEFCKPLKATYNAEWHIKNRKAIPPEKL